jgi:hypothetical protein
MQAMSTLAATVAVRTSTRRQPRPPEASTRPLTRATAVTIAAKDTAGEQAAWLTTAIETALAVAAEMRKS